MKEQQHYEIRLTEEQLDALAASFLPSMQRFFASERGKKLFEEYQQKNKQPLKEAA